MKSLTSKPWFLIISVLAIIIILFSIRFQYGHDILLTGDEIGVTIVQSVGKWDLLRDSIPTYQAVPMDNYREFYKYSTDFSVLDVLAIMWKDKLHPPLHFILLHYLIALFGNSLQVLRLFSVIISIGSVFFMYLLGKALVNKQTGVIAALFMALSPYCLEHSVMVRLYPLAMLLALMATYFLVLIVKKPSLSFRDKHVYFYMLVSLAGLYTYYSFAVILLSHLIFFMLSMKWSWKNLGKVLLVYFFILLLFLPWVFPFLGGIGQVSSKDLYFKGSYTLGYFVSYYFRILFFPYDNQHIVERFPFISWVVLLLTTGIVVVFLWGIYRSLKQRVLRNFIISIGIYLLISIVNDKILNTSTFIFDRQHYFSIPAILLILAIFVWFFLDRNLIRIALTGIILLMLIAGSIYRFNNKSRFDGPYYFEALNKQLNENTKKGEGSSCLVIFNMKEKRYILPFVHSCPRNFDLMLMPVGFSDSLMTASVDLSKYESVFAVNIDLNERKRKRLKLCTFNDAELFSFFDAQQFSQAGQPFEYRNEEKMTLYHFKKTSGSGH